MLPNCDLVIVDDVDVGVRVGEVGSHLIHPEALAETLTLNAGSGRSPLAWLGDRRSVWVIGDVSQESAWRSAIARLLGIQAREIATVHIGSSPSPTPNQPAIA
jgi:hypothetical protein